MDERIDDGYTGVMSIPKEVKMMRDAAFTVMGISISLKQLGYIIGGFIAFFLVYKIFSGFGITILSMFAGVLAALPFFAFGFFKMHGLSLEDYLLVIKANHMSSKKIRNNDRMDEYEKLEDLTDTKMNANVKSKLVKTKKTKKTKTDNRLMAFT